MSSSPCVGCAWRPSPALITCTCEATWFAIRWAAPLEECRTTNMSAYIAERLSTVSSRVSPLVEDDTVMFRLMTSADRRFAAISKVVRVRVEASKNRLNTDLPRRSGTFFTSRSVTPMKDAAVSRMFTRTSRGSPSIVSRCRSVPSPLSCGFRIGESQEESAALVARQAQKFHCGDRKRGTDILCRDRQLPFAAVHQRRKLDFAGTPIVEQLVHRGAHGAPGVEHVVDHHDMPPVDVERDLRRLHLVVQSGGVEIVAVKRDIQGSHGRRELQFTVQALCKPGAAGSDADEAGGIGDAGAKPARELLAQRFSVWQIHQDSSAG